MAKWAGLVGYATESEEKVPGVWTDGDFIEKHQRGDIIRASKDQNTETRINDDITLQNRISIVADSYIKTNFEYIRYIVWRNVAWKVTDIELQYPRIIVTLGGVWNGERANSTGEEA